MVHRANISQATLVRLPGYLRYLTDRAKEGYEHISSTVIAKDMHLNPVQVRKDLAVASRVAGKPKAGFSLTELIRDIEDFLGFHHVANAVLMGAGQLGSALMGYEGFTNYGLNIVAAFDKNPAVQGKKVNGKPVLPVEELSRVVKENHVSIGIITVGKEHAQEVAETLIAAGIRGIWNFAPQHLLLPAEIAIKHEDMAASLAILSKKLFDLDN